MPFSGIDFLRRFHPRSSPGPVSVTPPTSSAAVNPDSFPDGRLTPPYMDEVHSLYMPVSVRLARPGVVGAWGARFELVAPPPRPLMLGAGVCLEIRWCDEGEGRPSLVHQPTRGRLVAIAGMRTDGVEFVLHNDTSIGEYEYLVSPLLKGCVTLPPRLSAAFVLLEPYVISSATLDVGRDAEDEVMAYLAGAECLESHDTFMKSLELVGSG